MMDKNSSLTKNIQIKKKQIWYLRIITNEKKWSKIETVFWDAAETCFQWPYRDVAWRVETGGYWLIKTQGAN